METNSGLEKLMPKQRRIIVIDLLLINDLQELTAKLLDEGKMSSEDKTLLESLLLTPEAVAMLQALYSRSSKSVLEHLEEIKLKGSSKFMSKWYVEYGHGSIGDGGTITIFIENVSILAAKAFEDSPLYAGQETSTRYIDMEQQPLVDPLNVAGFRSGEIQERWMDFYRNSQEETTEYLKTVYPREEGQDDKDYNKAIKARVFDVLRAFLPAGVCTQFSWHTSLRHAAERLAVLRHHPLLEVRQIAEEIHTKLKEGYPSSFSHKTYEATEAYHAEMNNDYGYYFNKDCPAYAFRTNIDPKSLQPFEQLLRERPPKTNLPYILEKLGDCTCDFLLDFGSWRDAQRHRRGICRAVLLTTKLGFHEWYLNELSPETRKKAEDLIKEQIDQISMLDAKEPVLQYYIPLGFLVSCQTTYGLSQMAYVIDLRTGKTVHPTYRQIAQKMARSIMDTFPEVKLYADMDEGNFDIKRGKQDIINKELEAQI